MIFWKKYDNKSSYLNEREKQDNKWSLTGYKYNVNREKKADKLCEGECGN